LTWFDPLHLRLFYGNLRFFFFLSIDFGVENLYTCRKFIRHVENLYILELECMIL